MSHLPYAGEYVPPFAGEFVLQFGFPGGPEILIILLMLLMMLLPIALVVLVVVGVVRLRGSGSTDDRVAALERRVRELESELRAERTREDESNPAPERDEDRW